jgi:deoxyribonuclease-4
MGPCLVAVIIIRAVPARGARLDPDLILGAHVPMAGGLVKAPGRGTDIGADAIQIFTRSQLQWRADPVGAEEALAFRAAVAASGLRAVLAHGSYLVNLASPDPAALARSRAAFVADMERCQALGVRFLIFHPGAHMGSGEATGLATIATSLDHVMERAQAPDVHPTLEVTAGQGSSLGHRFEQIAAVLALMKRPECARVCLDTCHLLAAGYDLATPRGHAETLRRFERVLGLQRLAAIHMNDARQGLGSHADRHAPIGKGCLGLDAFRRIVRDPRLRGVPMILETPGGLAAWAGEITLLRRLARSAPGAPQGALARRR